MTNFETENSTTDSILLLLEPEWRAYLMDSDGATLLYEKRRKLAKLTKLEAGCCFLYLLLFIAGLAANGWALRVVGTVLIKSAGRQVNVLAYIGMLALVNLVILAFLPIAVTDIVVGEWLFPDIMCPIYWAVETSNKTVSPLLLACLTVACYCAVCRPGMVRMYRSAWVSAVHIVAVAGITAWKAKPFVEHSDSFHLVAVINGTTSVNYGKKCLFHPPEDSRVVEYVTWDGFLSTYLLPMLYMIGFYSAILRTIMVQSRSLGRRAPPRHFWRAAKSAALLVGFYFFCWTPYWSVTLALELLPHVNSLWSAVAFAAHVLPLVNCAFSPLLYTLTNSHVRTLHRTAIAVRKQRYKLRSRSCSTRLLEDTYARGL